MYLHYIKIIINSLPYSNKIIHLWRGKKKKKKYPILSQRNQLVSGPASTVKKTASASNVIANKQIYLG